MKQFAIIGLGSFGFYLATRLYQKGHEVIAIDKDASLIQEIRDQVTQAIIADATDAKALEAIGLRAMDAAIVCMGSILSESILATLNLKEIGCKVVYAKAHSESHGRILEKIGATEVLFPEKDQAIQLAERLHTPNMLDFLPFAEDHAIVQLTIPKPFVGKSLKDINLINRFGIQVVAVQEVLPDRLNMIPKADYVLKKGDNLIILGPNRSIEKLRKNYPE
ncbi:TrkA family potassium uptake protein [Desulfobotulus sp.]|jgi:trk system potassium uptake protein TrkA|uniref:potassium channel family protein n=1 Tax=Desulfobotulus sp. TaxID=1940337 RepID=UPI002A3670BB|nr:TrkA family potassium uptake protein [Desulfobotulus sp.]MDY0162260.1 TrkA family potassium uptake protein [Desulfobotulus sp.]